MATKPLTLDDLANALRISEGCAPGEFYTLKEVSKDIYRLHVRAILTTIKEAGYAIVPVEADEAMIQAGIAAQMDWDSKDDWSLARLAESIHAAMIETAPQIEGE